MTSKESLKALFIRDREFLRALFEGPNPLKNKRLLASASESQIETLIKYLHYLSNGKIRIAKENFQNLKKKRKFNYLKENFESQVVADNLIHSDLSIKQQKLLSLSTAFPDLLAPLFVLPMKQQPKQKNQEF